MLPEERDDLNAAVTATVKRDICAVVPERAEELSEIWEKYEPEVRVLDEREGFTLEGGPYQKIYVSPKDGRLLWLAAFVAWRAVEGFSGYIFEKLTIGGKLDLNAPDLRSSELRGFFDYVALLTKMMDLREAESLVSVEWPKDVPQPRKELRRESLALPDQACFDLAHFSEAFVFLHEIRHVMYFADADTPDSKQEEEMSCDYFAIDFLLGRIPTTGNQAGDSAEAIRRKRAMALALGLSLPILIASSQHWGHTQTHPAVRERFEQLVSAVHLPPMDTFWIFASALVLARVQAEGKLLAPIKAVNVKELLLNLLSAL